MVAEGDRSTGSKGRSPPKDQDRSPPAGAEGRVKVIVRGDQSQRTG